MRMRKLLLLILTLGCLLGCVSAQAAGPKYPGWLTVMVPETAQFDVPPLLEVQTKEYRDIVRKKIADYPDPAAGCVTLQKKGLLEDARQGKLDAQTVMITFATRNLGQDSGFKRGKLGMTEADLQDFTTITMRDTMQDKKNKYFDWQPAVIAKLPCGEAIKISYKRQYQNAPATQYSIHYVFDGPMLYTMTVAFNVDEADQWCANFMDIRDIPSTLKIIKK